MSQAGVNSIAGAIGVPITVPNGGTGDTSFIPYAVITGGVTSTSPLQSVASVGTLGQVLTSNGLGMLPSFTTLPTGVLSVSGTPNRITSTGGANPVIDIAATYVGQTSLTTLGTITTGTWNGTTIGPTFGGTGQTTYATGDILYASAPNVLSKLPAGSNTNVLTLAAGVPSWAAPATSGTVTSVSVVTANGFAGTVATATTTPAITLTTTQTGLLSGNGTSITGTAITQYNVITGGATNLPNSVAPTATSGIPLISQGAASQPIFGTAVVAGGGTGAVTLTGILTGNGTSAFTASTVTQHGVLVGGASNAVSSTAVGSTGQVLQANTGADPTYSTATYPSTTTINQILYSSAANTVTGLATANSAALVTGSTGVPVFTSTMTNGQVVIGSTGATPTAATLTAGTGITITPGAGSITIASTVTATTWVNQTADLNPLVAGNSYEANKGTLLTLTLPTGGTFGQTIRVQGFGAGGWKLNAGTGQTIQVNANATTVAGSVSSTNQYDYIELVCSTTTTTWLAIDHGGNLTLA